MLKTFAIFDFTAAHRGSTVLLTTISVQESLFVFRESLQKKTDEIFEKLPFHIILSLPLRLNKSTGEEKAAFNKKEGRVPKSFLSSPGQRCGRTTVELRYIMLYVLYSGSGVIST